MTITERSNTSLAVMPAPWVWEIFHCSFLAFKGDLCKAEQPRCTTFNRDHIRKVFVLNTMKEQDRSQEPDHFLCRSHNTKCRTMGNKGDCYPHSLLDAICSQPGYFFCFFIRATFTKKEVSEKKNI